MESLKTIGERIKYARKLKGLTQNDIYKLTGISSGNLSDIENNKVLPSANALISLKRELGVSIDWILTGEADVAFDKKQNKSPSDIGKLSPNEIDILLKYRKLDDVDKEEIDAIIDIKLHRKNKKYLS
ncbi:Helix-turn-helix domain protein [Tepidanaerobacter acetatoxydans Re1]|uniref:Helix-turn-helix domain protein n=1 Tax=Tepidanaerobacter acetatoxydans (strain DSM 21804 / JCM 16047 / Re1) TaxID=1209989 RepID=F4LXQ6_TEPAE|nr:helix-turn-helix transcriptional regulator [Tepidanaerobacter acetatoxydans]AEE91985.1 helix-turn-helix domain protein [Tepidanaerobacter acetatoxydans Re1]CCP26824.1 Helix-turn-helix domain protein [Tepidanaerobacter acetatoxydans Re1]